MSDNGPILRPPAAVLFMCTLNAVRSPMAAALFNSHYRGKAYVASCGTEPAEMVDGLMVSVMAEQNFDLSAHVPVNFDSLEDASFDLIIALSSSAYAFAQEFAQAHDVAVIHWPLTDPASFSEGSRDRRLEAYRTLRKDIDQRILALFSDWYEK